MAKYNVYGIDACEMDHSLDIELTDAEATFLIAFAEKLRLATKDYDEGELKKGVLQIRRYPE